MTSCACGLPITRYRVASVDGRLVMRITHEDSLCEFLLRGHEADVVLRRLGLASPPR